MEIFRNSPLGESLVEDGIITRNQLNIAMMIQDASRKSGEAIVKSGKLSAAEFKITMEAQLADIIMGLGYASEEDIFGTPILNVSMKDFSEEPLPLYN
ncbi:hypothetical protein GF312_09560 [Candidatus Poribacteria bacterium]|nr:hypothetical protein [Candidatus Poribacteria bacterium]